MSKTRSIPLPFTCQHEAYEPGAKDAHGNTTPGWKSPVDIACMWWAPTSTELTDPPTGGERVSADVVLVMASSVSLDHRDRFTIEGKRFESQGLPKDYNHGPFRFSPDRLVVELKRVG